MNTGIFKSARLRSRIIILLGSLLIILGIFLFYSSYRAQLSTQEANLGRWRHDNQLRASALSYFYNERCNEVVSLADNPTVTSYFLNKSLGMTLRYGLGSTLNSISQLFEQVISSQRLDGEGIYQALVLLDFEGRLLCMAREPGFAVNETRRSWSYFVRRDEPRPAVVTRNNELNTPEVLISVPVFFNQKYGGQLLAWIDYALVFKVFAAVENIGERYAWVINEDGVSFNGTDNLENNHNNLAKIGEIAAPVPGGSDPLMLEIIPGRGRLMVMTAVVENTPFILVESMSRNAMGYHTPATYLAYMLVFGLATFFISALLLRSLMMNARLEEVVRRENEIAEKNKLLEKEITDRLRSEVELAESRQRLTLVLKGADIGFWDWDVESDVVVHNQRLTEMVGYEEGELPPVALSWQQLIHPDDLPATQAALKEHFQGKNDFYEAEYRVRHKNGQWLWMLDRGAVVKRDVDGKPLRVAGTHLDITPRKKAEQELRAAHELLEKRVEERTRELRQAQGALVNRALEEGRSQLAAMVLHNIGNAITPVTIYLEQYKQSRLSEICRFQERCMRELETQRSKLSEFVNQDERGREIFTLLAKLIDELPRELQRRQELNDKISATISHVGEIISLQQSYAGAGREIKENVDLNLLVADTLRLQEDSIKKRQIKYGLKPVQPSPRITIDKNRLVQVLVNMIKNSCEAIDQNEPGRPREIYIRTFSRQSEAGFEIADSGIGISRERLNSIFAFGESGKGSSGFGLHYCKMFIEANHGRIEVDSSGHGQGATISVVLPKIAEDKAGESYGK